MRLFGHGAEGSLQEGIFSYRDFWRSSGVNSLESVNIIVARALNFIGQTRRRRQKMVWHLLKGTETFGCKFGKTDENRVFRFVGGVKMRLFRGYNAP